MYLKIKFTDGTEIREYYESFRIREGCLILDVKEYLKSIQYQYLTFSILEDQS